MQTVLVSDGSLWLQRVALRSCTRSASIRLIVVCCLWNTKLFLLFRSCQVPTAKHEEGIKMGLWNASWATNLVSFGNCYGSELLMWTLIPMRCCLTQLPGSKPHTYRPLTILFFVRFSLLWILLFSSWQAKNCTLGDAWLYQTNLAFSSCSCLDLRSLYSTCRCGKTPIRQAERKVRARRGYSPRCSVHAPPLRGSFQRQPF